MNLSEKLHIAISDYVSSRISVRDMCILLAEARDMARRVEEAPVGLVMGQGLLTEGAAAIVQTEKPGDVKGKRVRIVEE